MASYHDFLRTEARERDAVVVGGSYDAVVADAAGTAGDADSLAPADWTPSDDRPLVNRAPVATPDGLDCYVKVHPTPGERESGTSCGTGAPVLVDHAGTTVGVVVCYDVEFPELVREAVDAGAEVLAVPSWTGTDAGAERVARCAAARAVENQCYVASVPLVGAGTVDVGALRESRASAAVRPYADYLEGN